MHHRANICQQSTSNELIYRMPGPNTPKGMKFGDVVTGSVLPGYCVILIFTNFVIISRPPICLLMRNGRREEQGRKQKKYVWAGIHCPPYFSSPHEGNNNKCGVLAAVSVWLFRKHQELHSSTLKLCIFSFIGNSKFLAF